MPDELRTRALGYLRTGAVIISHAEASNKTVSAAPDSVTALVRGHQRTYVVDLVQGMWSCQCPPYSWHQICRHIVAVQIVTGHYRPAEMAQEVVGA